MLSFIDNKFYKYLICSTTYHLSEGAEKIPFYIIYIAFGILLQFIVEVKSQITIFNPDVREGHTATFINDKLYILGGATPFVDTKSPRETFLYLDFSSPFNTSGLKWVDLSTNN